MEDRGSMDEISSDEELCTQLKDAGLKIVGRKRPRKQSFNDVKILRLDFNQNSYLETEKTDFGTIQVIKILPENSLNEQNPTLDSLQQSWLHEIKQSPHHDLQLSPVDLTIPPSNDIYQSMSDDLHLPPPDDLHQPPPDDLHQPPPDDLHQPPPDDLHQPPHDDLSQPTPLEPSHLIIQSIQSPPSPKIVILSNVPYHGDFSMGKKRQNKASKEPAKYQRNINKEKRLKGESYLGYRRDVKTTDSKKFKVKNDVLKPARSIKPPCTSSYCKKSKFRTCETITDEQRSRLFHTFWKTMNWEQRRSFICSHVTKHEKKVTKNPDSNRKESRAYFLTINNTRCQVCQKMFLATLGIKNWFVRYWLSKTDCAMPPDLANSTKNRRAPAKTDGQEYVKKFLGDLPKMPSHYCRASTSREYLEPLFQNMTQLYNKYKESCELESQQLVGRRLFDNIFLKLNLSIFHPKKDQCDTCCSYNTGNITEEQHAIHISKKNQARKEKDMDKSDALSGKCHLFTQDVESVKLAQYLQASAIYYKTKLCVHNFTLYNLASKEVMCYWFDEVNSTPEASVFACCLVDTLRIVLSNPLLLVILFSDGCCAQNRNAVLSNALLRLSIEKQIVITQKYLQKGHTHMECDSVHSAIECKLKGKEIFLPSQYVSITKTARKDPMPYEARLLDYSFFTDFSKDLIYKSIRPGKKVNDSVVTDLRMLEYRPNGTIWYKVNFDDKLLPLPHRPAKIDSIKPISELPKLYKSKIPLSKRKYQDLQDLKSVLPRSCHSFYDELPYCTT